jgi:signal transduction histidine kinase
VSARGWSLAGRIKRLFLTANVAIVVLVCLFSAIYVRGAVRREISTLPEEELGEAAGTYLASDGSTELLRAELDRLARMHGPTRFAWRVHRSDGRQLDFGETELLADGRPGFAEANLDRTVGDGGTLRWRSARMPGGDLLGIVIDGGPLLERLHLYEACGLIVVGTGVLLTFFVSTLLARRISILLGAVAQRARAVRAAEEHVELDIPDAPREIRQVTDALAEMLENIRSESRQARLFTAGLAHELRAPVQNLIGETEVALLADRDGAEYRKVLRSNLDELRSLGDAVDNLVTICSAGDARRYAAREHFDLGVETALRLSRERSLAERRGVRFTLETRGDVRVTGDREALLRAVRNVTANAVQWSDAGGTVEVLVAGRDSEIEVCVDDSGPGVSPEIEARIFEPFFRGPAARGRRVGFGLGLALARMALVEHGGRIEVERSPLGGARFRLSLPRQPLAHVQAGGNAPHDTSLTRASV